MCVFSRVLLLSCVVGCRGGGGQSFCLWGWGVPSTGTGCYLLAVHSCRGVDGPGKSELARSVAAKREGRGGKKGRWRRKMKNEEAPRL